MVDVVLGRDLGKRLCEILGLQSKGVTRIALECKPDEAVMVHITKFVEQEQAVAIGDEFQKYTLGEEMKMFQLNERAKED